MLVRDPALAERLRFVGLIGWSPKVVGSHARLAVLQIGAASDARDLRHAHTLLGFAHEDRRVQRDAGPAQWAGACCCRLRGKGPRQALGTEDVAAGRTTRLRWRRREADGAFQLARHVGAALRPVVSAIRRQERAEVLESSGPTLCNVYCVLGHVQYAPRDCFLPHPNVSMVPHVTASVAFSVSPRPPARTHDTHPHVERQSARVPTERACCTAHCISPRHAAAWGTARLSANRT